MRYHSVPYYRMERDEHGTKRWFDRKGSLHRDDNKPAIEWADGSKAWYWHGLAHRTDGPAFEYPDGSKSWMQYGVPHREDGPSFIAKNGYKSWNQNGKRHRLDGPAVEWANGTIEYWINDKKLTEDEFNNLTRPLIGKKVKINGKDYVLA